MLPAAIDRGIRLTAEADQRVVRLRSASEPGTVEIAAGGGPVASGWGRYVAAVVDELYTVVRKAKSIDLPMLRGYLAELRLAAPTHGPAEQFLVKRIEGLERLVSLK